MRARCVRPPRRCTAEGSRRAHPAPLDERLVPLVPVSLRHSSSSFMRWSAFVRTAPAAMSASNFPPSSLPTDVPGLPAPGTSVDLFVAHAAADRAFVHGYLLPALGLPAERVRLTGDAAPSPEAIAALAKVVEVSRVTLVVLTPAFLADPWARCTEQWASHAAISGRAQRDPAGAGALPGAAAPARQRRAGFSRRRGVGRRAGAAAQVLPPPAAAGARAPLPLSGHAAVRRRRHRALSRAPPRGGRSCRASSPAARGSCT